MQGIQYTTNRYGQFVAYPVKESLSVGGAINVTKSESCFDEHWGIGVAITDSSCYNLMLMNKKDRTALLEDLYSKEGLGLSVARLCIGSCDYSARVYSYADTANDIELKDFSIAKDLDYIIPVVKEIMAINPDISFYASPWSPPYWMKTGGNMCGGFMRSEYIDCYAEYFVKFIKAYEELGINIKAVTAQNEVECQLPSYPTCMWHPDDEADFIIALRNKFQENGIKTEIWCHDHNFNLSDRVDWLMGERELYKYCDAAAFHYYTGSIEDTDVLKKYEGLKLHFTEGGPRLLESYADDWCKWASMIIKTLNRNYLSFAGWNLMLDETGGPNVGPYFCGGLVTRNRVSGELTYSGQYKAFRHFSPYINKESKIYNILTDKVKNPMGAYPKGNARQLEGAIIENKDNEVLLFVNHGPNKAQLQYEFEGKLYYIELLPETVATVVLEK